MQEAVGLFAPETFLDFLKQDDLVVEGQGGECAFLGHLVERQVSEKSLENQVARLLDPQGVVVLARKVTLGEILLQASLAEVKSPVTKD